MDRNQQAMRVMGHVPVSVIQALEKEKMTAEVQAACISTMVAAQAQLSAAFVTTPGDSQVMRVRQGIVGMNGEPIQVETVIELL